jgi:hypothetical protein
MAADWHPVLELTRVYWVSQAPPAGRSKAYHQLVVVLPRRYPLPEVYLEVVSR